MKRTITLLLLLAVFIIPAKGQDVQNVKQVKNVILLIPDGTSLATVSTARWLQWYTNPSKPKLNLDPYLCGTVRTLCSNEPIGDSAPTTSCYMTGYTSRAGWVSTYPLADPQNDIYPNDPKMAYQPLTTVLEAAKMLYGKSTGLVFTCEFPHATPADCASHSYNRSRYDWIAPQMVHNDLNVVIGGGAGILNTEEEAYLKGNGYGVFKNDINGMRSYAGNNMWALYCDHEMAYDIDRDTTKEPALEEMTRIAIDKLSKNPQGFFLMVEGSKVDWAAHANDPVGMATDMLAYDRACGVALDF
ncbi:MAG: alkaline phosphatase, partial [Parabacteroides sp.]